jgi:hypothetical protein
MKHPNIKRVAFLNVHASKLGQQAGLYKEKNHSKSGFPKKIKNLRKKS